MLMQNSGKNHKFGTELLSFIWTLQTNTFLGLNFLYICTLVEQVIRNNFAFRIVV
jgi:hypothetical protein